MIRLKPFMLLLSLALLAFAACRTNTTGEREAATTNAPAAAEGEAADDGPDFGEDDWGLAGAPMKGAADGLVTIVEFSDFQCPFCGRVNPTIAQILSDEDFAGKVRIVFLQLPLSF